MTLKNTLYAAIVGGLLFITLVGAIAYAYVDLHKPTPENQYKTFNALNATTTSATSTNLTGGGGWFDIAGAEKVTFFFSRGGTVQPNTGSSKFEVEVSYDGTTWHDFNRLWLTGATKTATSTVWITAATTTVIASMDLDNNAFLGVRCQVVEVTDGEHSCYASAQY